MALTYGCGSGLVGIGLPSRRAGLKAAWCKALGMGTTWSLQAGPASSGEFSFPP